MPIYQLPDVSGSRHDDYLPEIGILVILELWKRWVRLYTLTKKNL